MTTENKTVVWGHGLITQPGTTDASGGSSGSATTIYLNDRKPTVLVKRPTTGRPTLRIEGTSTRVSAIVEYRRLGYSVDRIVRAMPHLTRQQVKDSLAIYQGNASVRKEVDEEVAAQKA